MIVSHFATLNMEPVLYLSKTIFLPKLKEKRSNKKKRPKKENKKKRADPLPTPLGQ